MSDINKIRLQRLAALAAGFRTQIEFAESGDGVSHKYINLLLNGKSAFGERTARNLEVKFGLEPFYFDQKDGVPSYELDVVLLAEAITEIEKAVALTKAKLTPKEKAILIVEYYADNASSIDSRHSQAG